MTTNSCTSKTSAPEEFWNCADVAVASADGDVGAEIAYSNGELEAKAVLDLLPAINSGDLQGVYASCPEDGRGNLLGVGAADDYEGLCGSMSDGTYERCVDLTGGSGSAAFCSDPPGSGIKCESECGEWWIQCSEGVAYQKLVPAGTKCKGNEFVLAATCDSYVTPEPQLPEEPVPSPAPVQTFAPTPAPTQGSPSTQAPAPGGDNCGACAGCLWGGSGICYDDVDPAYCGAWPNNRWCGSNSLSQIGSASVKRHTNFLGAALIQQAARMENAAIETAAADEL